MMTPPPPRGFSLVEAAIVLAIVGLVIGGIWAAARAVNENLKWSRAQTGLLYYFNMMNKHFNARVMAGTTTIDPYNFLMQMPLPAGWSKGGPYGFHPVDPYGHSLTFQIQAHQDRFYIGFHEGYPEPNGARYDICVRYSQFYLSHIYKSYVRTSGGPAASCATNRANCCTGGNHEVGAYFRLPHQ